MIELRELKSIHESKISLNPLEKGDSHQLVTLLTLLHCGAGL